MLQECKNLLQYVNNAFFFVGIQFLNLGFAYFKCCKLQVTMNNIWSQFYQNDSYSSEVLWILYQCSWISNLKKHTIIKAATCLMWLNHEISLGHIIGDVLIVNICTKYVSFSDDYDYEILDLFHLITIYFHTITIIKLTAIYENLVGSVNIKYLYQ